MRMRERATVSEPREERFLPSPRRAQLTVIEDVSTDYLWPSLFGRATLLRSHEQGLQTVFAALRAATQPVSARTLERAGHEGSRLPPALYLLLARHFAAEESEFYHGVLEASAPYLRHQLDQLRAEHLILLKLLARLVGYDAPRDVAAHALPLMTFLQAHERKESALMHEFLFGQDT